MSLSYLQHAVDLIRRRSSGGDSPTPLFTIVICSIDANKFERVTANYRELFREVPIEIIGIHDARSLSEAYNRGIDKARGEFLILSHDDIMILSPDFVTRLRTHLRSFDLIGVAVPNASSAGPGSWRVIHTTSSLSHRQTRRAQIWSS